MPPKSCRPFRPSARHLALALTGCLAASTTLVRAADGPATPQPLTLPQALERALSSNTNIVIAKEDIRVAEARLREARAASLPTLVGTGVYTRLDADRKQNGSTIAAADQLSANLNLTVPLIVPQRWAQWSTASVNEKTAEAAADDVRRQVAVTVARAYLTVVTQRRVIEENERAWQTAKVHADFAHTRLVGGIGNRVDYVRAAQEVASDEAALESARTALVRGREALGVLLGGDTAVDVVSEVTLGTAPPLATAMEEAVTLRRDVALGKARKDAAERTRKNGYTDYLPFLIGSIQPFYQNPPTLTQPQTGWQAQLVLTVPLYDGGLRYGLADERAALSSEAHAQYEALVRQARSDVRVAFETVKRTESSLASANDAARLAHEALELANVAYRAGATTNIEVIDAERRARDADTVAAVAEDTARQARVDLLAASGRFP